MEKMDLKPTAVMLLEETPKPRIMDIDKRLLERQRAKLVDLSEAWLESAQECYGTGEKDLEMGFMRVHSIYVRALNDVNALIHDREPTGEIVKRDARRWNAFLNCARIRILGWAGLDGNFALNPDREFSVHFGAEFWTRFLLRGQKEQDDCQASNEVARKVITAFTDAAVVLEDQARGLEKSHLAGPKVEK